MGRGAGMGFFAPAPQRYGFPKKNPHPANFPMHPHREGGDGAGLRRGLCLKKLDKKK